MQRNISSDRKKELSSGPDIAIHPNPNGSPDLAWLKLMTEAHGSRGAQAKGDAAWLSTVRYSHRTLARFRPKPVSLSRLDG
jgi:hypothetical protein